MKITVYTAPNCANCVAAKQLLKSKGLPYKEINLVSDEERQGFYQIAGPGVRQMPQIYVGDERIGGLAGLTAWIKWKEEQ